MDTEKIKQEMADSYIKESPDSDNRKAFLDGMEVGIVMARDFFAREISKGNDRIFHGVGKILKAVDDIQSGVKINLKTFTNGKESTEEPSL